MWRRLLPLDSAEQYTALLGIEKSDSLDGGKYTCQVTDWGYQQCKSITLEVLQAPQVKVDPMSLTVEKVKCQILNLVRVRICRSLFLNRFFQTAFLHSSLRPFCERPSLKNTKIIIIQNFHWSVKSFLSQIDNIVTI